MSQDRALTLTYSDQLYASDFNALLDHVKQEAKKEKYFCEEGFVKVGADHSIEQEVNYFIIEKDYPQKSEQKVESKEEKVKKRFVIFNVAKDAESKETQRFIPWISEVIKNFREKKPEEKGILLIPMTQCLEWSLPGFLLSIYATIWGDPTRKHFTLVEVDLTRNKLILHDSTSKGLYPDKIKEILCQVGLEHIETDYRAYSQQNDNHSCGYFIYFYISSIIHLGDSNDLDKIKLSSADVLNKKDFLENRQVKLAGERDKIVEIEESEDENEDILLINKLTCS